MSEIEHPGGGPVDRRSKTTSGHQSLPRSETERWTNLVPEGILCLDEQWLVLFANRVAKELFAEDAVLEIGKPAWQSAALATFLAELQLETLKSGARKDIRTLRQAEVQHAGSKISFEVSISISGEAPKRVFTLVMRDISAQGPVEAKLYQSQKQQVIGALAGGIAHDFNNVLTAVICRLEQALEGSGLPEEARDDVFQALASARRGAELNAKLMSFSRLGESKPAPVDVIQLIEETIFILRRTIDRRIQIQSQPPDDELWHALADEDQLMQVLMNLCLNARDAMPKGGELTIGAVNRTFNKDAQPPRHPGEFVRLTVSDTGHGMSPEVLSRLFEPYFSTKGFGKGAGLGLSIANHVVVEHGGWMEVESQHAEGSRFHLFLPRTTASLPVAELKEHRMEGDSVLKGGETLLLVDDEDSVRSVIKATLTFRGYSVVEAVDGEDAVTRYRDAAGKIDLVLLDLQMPRMNGWDALEKILAINPQARILVLSGASPVAPRPGTVERAAGVLMKPFQSVQLLRAVREALDL